MYCSRLISRREILYYTLRRFGGRQPFCAACCAANGVPLREPRKPSEPELFQLTVLPCVSAMVTMVLLNDAWICTIPKGTFLRSFFLKVFPVGLPFFSVAPAAAAG